MSLSRLGMQQESTSYSPFVKWAGGKTQLLGQFRPAYPRKFNVYYEPFLGGGAVFFDLSESRRIAKAVLNDANKDLMNLWAAVKEDVDGLVGQIESLQPHVSDRSYYNAARKKFSQISIRDEFLSEPNIEKAALLVYLNKTCYNGLYRVNSKGEFNVPFGRYKNPRLLDHGNLLAVNRLLKDKGGVRLMSTDFESALDGASEGDFVYLDPPYQPLSATSSFTAYTPGGFASEDQKRLAEVFADLDRRGCKLMLSNSRHEGILKPLYTRYFDKGLVMTVKAARAISSIGNKRGKIKELVIMNYTSSATSSARLTDF